MPTEAVKRRVEEAKLAMEAHSRSLEAQQLAWQKGRTLAGMFPSTIEGDRGATSPLGGLSPGVWSGGKGKA
jgi:hypothetical protein